jgi:hypothetical protein
VIYFIFNTISRPNASKTDRVDRCPCATNGATNGNGNNGNGHGAGGVNS